YYAVRVGHEPGIYLSPKQCKEQIHEYPGALYKKFDTRQQAEDFIKPIEDIRNNLSVWSVWTDGYCYNCKEINGKKQYLGKLNSIAGIGVFFADNDDRNLSERLPGEIQTNNRAELYAAIRALEIVDKQQDIILNTDSSKKKFTRLELPTSKRLIDHYFIKKSVDNSENANDSYIDEFIRMFIEKRIDKWLKNGWVTGKEKNKLKAPKDICLRINEIIKNRKN
ncbi:11606_t:CDS:2, partial [Racocetra persica]